MKKLNDIILSEYFRRWSKLNLKRKSFLLGNFIQTYHLNFGHNELDDILNKIWDLFGMD